ncbi:MAG TPA: cation diffusion facilitator family transporter [Aquabacterium sp.]|nr:cation diffusion facilitator family transporter [Aquabacterium sp.]
MHASSYLKLSVVVALATIVLKTAAWGATGSVGLLSDAIESLVNLAAALFALMMVTIAAQPADEEHPYGHHKAEYFSAGFEGVLIVAAALAIVWEAVGRFARAEPLQSLGLGVALSVAASVLNGVLAVAMKRAALVQRSEALAADGRHLMTDVWTSIGVVTGIGAVHFTGWLWLDPVIAIGVAANIAREGWRLSRRSVDGLMDRAIEAPVRQQIERTLAGFAHHTIRFDHLSTRRAGQRRFADLHMHMPADWSLRRAAALRGNVEQALMSAVPGLRVTIQLLPLDVEAHFDDEKDPL